MNNWWNYLEHSKGPWKNHKYDKVIDGVYYYPEGYKGGKYSQYDEQELNELKKMENADKRKALNKLYKELEDFDGDPMELLDTDSERGQDFSLTMAEFTGVDLKEMGLSDEEIEKMRRTAFNHYKKKSGKNESKSDLKKTDAKKNISEEDLNQLALEAIRGNYGNGQERKDKLGDKYTEVQKRVNEMIRSGKFSRSGSSSSKSSESKSSLKSEKHEDQKKRDYRYKTTVKTKTIGNKKRKVIKRERESITHSALDELLKQPISSYMNDNNTLMHFGTPRRSGRYPWGSGKDPYQSRRRNNDDTEEKEMRAADKKARAERLRDSKYRRLFDNKTLDEKIKRFETEKRLKDLTEEEITPGYKFVKSVLNESGKRIAVNALSGAGSYMLKSAISKNFDNKEFADALFYGGPKKGK